LKAHETFARSRSRFIRSRFDVWLRPRSFRYEGTCIERLGTFKVKPKEKGRTEGQKEDIGSRGILSIYRAHVFATAFSHRANVTFKAKANMEKGERKREREREREGEEREREESSGTTRNPCTKLHWRHGMRRRTIVSCHMLSPVSEKHIYSKGNFVIESLYWSLRELELTIAGLKGFRSVNRDRD